MNSHEFNLNELLQSKTNRKRKQQSFIERLNFLFCAKTVPLNSMWVLYSWALFFDWIQIFKVEPNGFAISLSLAEFTEKVQICGAHRMLLVLFGWVAAVSACVSGRRCLRVCIWYWCIQARLTVISIERKQLNWKPHGIRQIFAPLPPAENCSPKAVKRLPIWRRSVARSIEIQTNRSKYRWGKYGYQIHCVACKHVPDTFASHMFCVAFDIIKLLRKLWIKNYRSVSCSLKKFLFLVVVFHFNLQFIQ